nr:hypothetical protein CFP56_01182 [Quercus suber]
MFARLENAPSFSFSSTGLTPVHPLQLISFYPFFLLTTVAIALTASAPTVPGSVLTTTRTSSLLCHPPSRHQPRPPQLSTSSDPSAASNCLPLATFSHKPPYHHTTCEHQTCSSREPTSPSNPREPQFIRGLKDELATANEVSLFCVSAVNLGDAADPEQNLDFVEGIGAIFLKIITTLQDWTARKCESGYAALSLQEVAMPATAPLVVSVITDQDSLDWLLTILMTDPHRNALSVSSSIAVTRIRLLSG